jgi:hypothetical protein
LDARACSAFVSVIVKNTYDLQAGIKSNVNHAPRHHAPTIMPPDCQKIGVVWLKDRVIANTNIKYSCARSGARRKREVRPEVVMKAGTGGGSGVRNEVWITFNGSC